MSLLIATGLSKAFGALDVFAGVDLRIEAGDRIGFVGAERHGQDHAAAHPGRRRSATAGDVAASAG